MAVSLFADKKVLFFILVWWVLAMIIQYLILNQTGVDTYHGVVDSVASNVILGFLCFLLSNTMRFYLPGKEKYWFILISSLVLCLIWLIFLLAVFYIVFPANDLYLEFLKKSSGVRFGAGFLLTSSITMFTMLLYNQQEQEALLSRQAETEKLNREAELFKLRQQLQPHFLFNSLNSISALTGTNPEKAREMIQQLSEFLRGMLRKDEEKMIPLRDELQYIRLYLEIEKVRFGHRLQTEINCDEEVQSNLLPPLILQPIVENAIKFGLYDTTGEVLIQINALQKEGYLNVYVSNPFDPQTSSPVKGTGFGITSIKRRLFLIFSRNDLVKTNTEDNRFITEVLIPQS